MPVIDGFGVLGPAMSVIDHRQRGERRRRSRGSAASASSRPSADPGAGRAGLSWPGSDPPRSARSPASSSPICWRSADERRRPVYGASRRGCPVDRHRRPGGGTLAVVALVALVAGSAGGHAAHRRGDSRRPRTPHRAGPVAQRLPARLPLPRAVTLGLASPFARPVRSQRCWAAVLFGTTAATFAIGLTSSDSATARNPTRAAGAVLVNTLGFQGGPDGPGRVGPVPSPGPGGPGGAVGQATRTRPTRTRPTRPVAADRHQPGRAGLRHRLAE